MHEPPTPLVQSFAIGNLRLTKVVDSLEPTSPRFLYVDKRKEDFDPHLEWLQPFFVDAGKRMLLSIHTFLIQTTHHTVVIDTCIGNDKQDLAFPQWNARQGLFLRDLNRTTGHWYTQAASCEHSPGEEVTVASACTAAVTSGV
jgi:hypothetical protein